MTSQLLFPTVIHHLQVEDFASKKNKIIKFIYKEREKDPEGIIKSNKGGWQSKPSPYIKDDNILLSTIRKTIESYFGNGVMNLENAIRFQAMWININKKGDYNLTHNHPMCHMAAVWWIKAPKDCGNLEFQSPHSYDSGDEMWMYTEEFKRKNLVYPSYHYFPTEGNIVLFPAHLNHRVDPNESDEDRISVSFNLLFNNGLY